MNIGAWPFWGTQAKGKEALLEKVATRRAEILSERFIRAGAPAEILSAVGLALASEGVGDL
eukprot:2462258-Amphidinium_carterae.1